ncbi:MAG: ABC transporter ATP-binding protein [Clostridium sp.]|uniref:ABC transporter ATP-binding protein n=1 Tax=Clostridium sp. TaxID=1506 RepID=UPI00305C6D84
MAKKNNRYKSIKWLTKFFELYKFYFFLSIVIYTLLVGINAVKVYLIQELINGAIYSQIPTLLLTILAFICVSAIGSILSYVSKLYNGKFVNYTIKDMRDKLAKHVTRIEFKQLDDEHAGDMVSRLNNDVNQMQQFLENSLSTFVSQLLLGIIAAIYLFIINWKILLMGLIITPFGMIVAYFVNKNTQKYYPLYFNELGKATAEVEQSILGVDVIKSFNLYDYFYKKIDYKYKNAFKAEIKAQKYVSLIQPACFTLSFAPRLIGVIYSGYLASKGEITIGTIILVLLLLEWIAAPTVFAPFFMNDLNRMLAATERVEEILNLPLERSVGQPFERLESKTTIRFKNVSFSYLDSEPVLKNLSFEIKNSSITALVGISGSGKSTIADLITCLYEYDDGSVELFGNELKRLNPKDVREQISIVSQETYLFPGTVAENIKYGSSNAIYQEVILAAQSAFADEFIQQLPNSYDTLIGEGGVGLSGGQKQRISLARALIKDAPIVIFDEPTASLDYYTENLVQETLAKLSKNKAVLVISHRLSTLLNADQIIVLNKGEIVEKGTKDELIHKKGKFYEIFKDEIPA